MKEWKKATVAHDTTIRETLQIIDKSSMQIALVVDAEGFFRGTVTDGDVRRGLLRGLELSSPVFEVANKNPVTASPGVDAAGLQHLMLKHSVRQIPIIDSEGRVVGLEVFKELLTGGQRDNLVVLMAGGQGMRLRPLTETCPKPLLEVGGKPILEIILESLAAHGFRKFAISVNYMADMIEGHFGDGSERDVEITYLREQSKLGTAGALSLLPDIPQTPLLVMNGDLLTNLNFGALMDFHGSVDSPATLCVREFDFKVPYGVVELSDNRLKALHEKPVHKFFVSAGVYVLSPQAVARVPRNQYYEMTTLFEELLQAGELPAVFPVREYWLDIGQMDDYWRAVGEYGSVYWGGP